MGYAVYFPVSMSQKAVAIALFCILLIAYSYSRGPKSWNSDSRLDLLYAIVDEQVLYIDAHHGNTGDKSKYGDHYYSDKAPGIAFLALPAFLATRGIGMFVPSAGTWANVSWITTIGSVGIITALGGACAFLFLCQYVHRKYAFVTVLGIFLGAAPYPYATFLFSHSAVVGLLTMSLMLIATKDVHSWKWIALSGLCSGLAFASEYPALLVIGGIFLLSIAKHGAKGLAFLVGMILPVILVLLYNYACFGFPLSIGYAHVVGWPGMKSGFFGMSLSPRADVMTKLLFSRSRGLFYWTPFLLMAIPGLYLLLRRWPVHFFVTIIVFISHVALISSYYMWDGGGAVGPRHLAVLLPLLLLPVAYGLAMFPRLGTALVIVSILLTGFATLIDPGALPRVDPLLDYYIPSFIDGRVRTNIANAFFGVKSVVSILPLLIIVFEAAGITLFSLKETTKLSTK